MPSPRHCLHCVTGLAALLVLLGGCALAPSTTATADEGVKADAPQITNAPLISKAPQADPTSTEQTQFHVLAGEMAAGRGQPKMAAQEFLQALDTEPSKDLAARATALALQAEDDDLALNAARRWLALDSTSLEAREIIVRLALHDGLDEAAYEQCDRIILDHPGGQDDGFHHVAALLSDDPAHAAAALSLMQRLVDAYPKLAGAYRAQSLLAQRYDDLTLGESAARSALKLEPDSKESSLLLVGALVKESKFDEADQLMEGVTRNNPNANDVRLKYAQLLLEMNQQERGREQLQRILKSDPNDSDARYLLGLVALDEHKTDEAEAQFEILAKKADRQSDAEYYLGRVAEARRDPKTALEHYQKVVGGPQALDAVVRRAIALGKLGRLDESRSLFQQLRQGLPQMSVRFTLAEGQMLLDIGDTDDAQKLYSDALTGDPDNVDLLYLRSLVYERAGHLDLAEADLRRVLAKTPDDARSLNALGYMLTVHSDRFDEAQKLIDKAMQLTPEEPAVMDSAGWLRYRQGHAQDALPLLQKAYTLLPDAEVAAHLGEVLWSLGEKEQARSLLSSAEQIDPDNVELRDAVKRIEQ